MNNSYENEINFKFNTFSVCLVYKTYMRIKIIFISALRSTRMSVAPKADFFFLFILIRTARFYTRDFSTGLIIDNYFHAKIKN